MEKYEQERKINSIFTVMIYFIWFWIHIKFVVSKSYLIPCFLSFFRRCKSALDWMNLALFLIFSIFPSRKNYALMDHHYIVVSFIAQSSKLKNLYWKVINFNVRVKYFSFSSENGVLLNLSLRIGIENKYPNKNDVMIEPPVIDLIPK